MRRIFPTMLALVMLVAPAVVLATEGLAGATVEAAGSDGRSDRRDRFEAWCRSNPAKCDELRARRAERRERCRANPEQCRAERQARFEAWCKDNAEKCQRIKARREQCRANPEQCRAERQARFDQRFNKADTDGDGVLSLAEAEKEMPRLARHFEKVDANQDGRVTREEIEAARKARAARRHKGRDS